MRVAMIGGDSQAVANLVAEPIEINEVSAQDSKARSPANGQSCRLKMLRDYHKIGMFPGSSTVEHSAVNRRVASSNLARGANLIFAINKLPRWVEQSVRHRRLPESEVQRLSSKSFNNKHFR